MRVSRYAWVVFLVFLPSAAFATNCKFKDARQQQQCIQQEQAQQQAILQQQKRQQQLQLQQAQQRQAQLLQQRQEAQRQQQLQQQQAQQRQQQEATRQAEALRQQQLKQQQEAARQAELQRQQQEQARQAEAQRQAETAKQRQLELQRQQEQARQQADTQRQQQLQKQQAAQQQRPTPAPKATQQAVPAKSAVAPTTASAGSTPSQSPTTGMTRVTLGNGQQVFVNPQGAFFDASGNPISNQSISSATKGAPAISSPSQQIAQPKPASTSAQTVPIGSASARMQPNAGIPSGGGQQPVLQNPTASSQPQPASTTVQTAPQPHSSTVNNAGGTIGSAANSTNSATKTNAAPATNQQVSPGAVGSNAAADRLRKQPESGVQGSAPSIIQQGAASQSAGSGSVGIGSAASRVQSTVTSGISGTTNATPSTATSIAAPKAVSAQQTGPAGKQDVGPAASLYSAKDLARIQGLSPDQQGVIRALSPTAVSTLKANGHWEQFLAGLESSTRAGQASTSRSQTQVPAPVTSAPKAATSPASIASTPSASTSRLPSTQELAKYSVEQLAAMPKDRLVNLSADQRKHLDVYLSAKADAAKYQAEANVPLASRVAQELPKQAGDVAGKVVTGGQQVVQGAAEGVQTGVTASVQGTVGLAKKAADPNTYTAAASEVGALVTDPSVRARDARALQQAGVAMVGSAKEAVRKFEADVAKGDARSATKDVVAPVAEAMTDVVTGEGIGRGVKTLSGAADAVSAASAPFGNEVGSASSRLARPTYKQSEIDVGKTLGSDVKAQASFKEGQNVPYGTKGSVRPDFSGNGFTVEVKNRDITNANALVNNIVTQARKRTVELPPGTAQLVRLDVRGQTYTEDQLQAIVKQIVVKSGGAIKPQNVDFIR